MFDKLKDIVFGDLDPKEKPAKIAKKRLMDDRRQCSDQKGKDKDK